jgi:hypothetical protein
MFMLVMPPYGFKLIRLKCLAFEASKMFDSTLVKETKNPVAPVSSHCF